MSLMDISVHSVRTQYLSGPLALDADVGPILNGAETLKTQKN